MLTILSVKYGPARLLTLNADLCRALNPGTPLNWTVVNNDGDAAFAEAPGDFTVVPGVPPPSASGQDRGSAHHAAALTSALPHIYSRYLLLLDQDFYVLRPGWIAEVLAHAEAKRLAFFGSVWHPRWTYQPRDFPSVHFLLIDTWQVPLGTLDFRPDMRGDRLDAFVSDPRLPLPAPIRTLLQVGKFRDTGWQVRQRYRTSGLKFECLVPHFDRAAALAAAHPLHRLTSALLPEPRRVIPGGRLPGDRAATMPRSFLRAASPLAYGRGWEEFYWQNEPFAFHLRGVGRGKGEQANDLAELERLVGVYGG